MRQFLSAAVLFVLFENTGYAQIFKKPVLTGMYLQWGYNREWYSKSSIHFSNGAAYNFTLSKVNATDKPDFDAIVNAPLDISIPQYNYRIGFYLNEKRTHAFELNFDHTKYVVTDYQTYHITGRIGDHYYDADTTFNPDFLHFEHTDGANFAHANYVGKQQLFRWRKKREFLSVVYKFGAGVVIPRTDVTYMGKRLNNKFHVAGYIISTETGIRIYPLKNLFLEACAKGGFANYLNSLASESGKASHKFYYFEVIGTIGFDINLRSSHKVKTAS
jgi:hypothetical protein